MQHSIIFFDGVCNLCTGSVKFVIKRDRKDIFRFAALQSDIAGQHLGPFGLSLSELNTIILLENGRVYQRSTAALRIARHLSGGWPLLYGFMVIPAFIRDFVYNQIARRRYRIWGREESCMVPTPAIKAKFL
ncbi:thiol-disulfide oxidoreductase DCC family protein [Pedobacter cryoconitis]|uniref:Putative DCC family thiol-disulfide oxidoreductase YuxK n=1 Tax=Pedobacter cryoconitis TaxID=188932 RepID=A0A7X0MK90_9SPHI|nr:DCC1-like thiol-disulfide oxidoreductase family protein [Pedobacter cryoconitis]MBB6500223.1 putative DCC family thiol-disulfide oxidoreductase YuxK [Pedobacter cryoconitis]